MQRVIPKEVEQDICSKYYTHTAQQIADEYNGIYKKNTIKGVWQRNGYTGKGRKLPSSDEEFLLRLEELGNLQKVADFYGAKRKTVQKKAATLGVKREPLITEEQKKEIRELYYKETASTVAARYGISAPYVGAIWRQGGLKGKTPRRYHLENENFFEDVSTDEQAYWLGFLASDGCVYKPPLGGRQRFVQIGLSIEDKEHLVKFQKALGTDRPLSITQTPQGRQAVSLSISSDKMAQDLARYGIHPKKTYDDNWPTLLKQELIPAYVRGYFDGDGSISRHFETNTLHNVGISITGYSHNLQHFSDFLTARNISNRFVEDKREYNKVSSTRRFGSICLPDKKSKFDFLHLIYDNASVYLDRKYALAQQFFEYYAINPKTWKVHKKE